MTINAEPAGPTRAPRGIRNPAPPPRAGSGRKNAIRLVALASAARVATDGRTLRAVVVAAIAMAAAARLAREGGNPLDWYFARGRDEARRAAQRKGASAR